MSAKGAQHEQGGKDEIRAHYKDKTVLVTGGVGSIGSEIVKQLLSYQPKQVRIFDNRETEMFHLQHFLKEHKNTRFLLGDIRDKERLRRAAHDTDFVFHAAAFKHVEACEYNPDEAVKTNINGTENVIDAALEAGTKKVMFISTDKAVNPINTMGATKLLGEKLIMNAVYRKRTDTRFSCVRFGNVLNSQGSVIPIFASQIRKGGPVTLTHDDMRRFFISIPDAVNLVLKSCMLTNGREIFILKMNAFRIKDLAEVMIDALAPRAGIDPKSVKTAVLGVRPGERMDELLMTEEESYIAEEIDGMFVIKPDVFFPHYAKQASTHAKIDQKHYNSRQALLLSKDQIKALLASNKLI